MEKIVVNVSWCDKNFGASLSENVPGAVVITAKSYDELVDEVRETLKFHVEGMIADGDDIPQWLREGDYEFEYHLDASALLQMCSPYASIAAISRASGITKNILEIGTFSGYSAISMAEGLPDDGRLYTFEINDEMEDFTRPWIEGSEVAAKISFIIGDALKEAPKLGITFDMAFMDGDKRTYRDCYEMVMTILKPGGFILADNTLWDGHVVDHAYDKDHQTQGIETFNDYIAQDPRVEQVILPIRDGLTLIRKK